MYHLLNKRDASLWRIFSNESCSEQWRTAQNSVLALGRSNAESICSAISNGNEVNNKLHTRFSSAVADGVEDNDVSSKSLLYSIDDVEHEEDLELLHSSLRPPVLLLVGKRSKVLRGRRQHGGSGKPSSELPGDALQLGSMDMVVQSS
ncbi:hypothetical protein EJB05_54598, partial [Eragrostis curvula]